MRVGIQQQHHLSPNQKNIFLVVVKSQSEKEKEEEERKRRDYNSQFTTRLKGEGDHTFFSISFSQKLKRHTLHINACMYVCIYLYKRYFSELHQTLKGESL